LKTHVLIKSNRRREMYSIPSWSANN
jgi:hypothetical protein